MLDLLHLAVSILILAAVLALHVDLHLPKRPGRAERGGRVRHRPHDALRLTNL